MQTLRRDPMPPEALAGVAATDAMSPGISFGSTVTMLGDYIGHHRRAESARTLAKIWSDDNDAFMMERDSRGSSLMPRQNRLLAALDVDAYADLLPLLEFVPLPEGRIICQAGGVLEHVYFPVSGIVSFLYESASGSSVEIALAGNDGLAGIHLLTGGSTTTTRAVVRNAGHGYRLRAEVLTAKFDSCPALRRLMLRYAQALIAQTTQAAVCHSHHRLEQQFARILLSTIDRLGSHEIALTQDTIASLLGVRRESITETAGRMQTSGLIRYQRGRITVLSRPRLDAVVCECYGVVRGELDRLLPPTDDAVGHPATSGPRALQNAASLSAGVPFGIRGHADRQRDACSRT